MEGTVRVVVMLVAVLALCGLARGELVSYWDFEGSPKTLANYDDRTTNGYDLTNNAGTAFIVGTALQGDYCARNRPDKKNPAVPGTESPKISVIEDALTITGWFKGGDTGDATEMNNQFGWASSGGAKPTLGGGLRLSDGTFSARLSVGCTYSGNPTGYETFDVSLSQTLAQSDWVFCALRFDGGDVAVWIGGIGDADLTKATGTLSQTKLFNPLYTPYDPVATDPRQFGPWSVPGFGLDYSSGETKAADELTIWDEAASDGLVELFFDLGKAGQPVPEPGTMGLLGLGGLAVLKRRRRG